MQNFMFVTAAAGILTLAGSALAAEWVKDGKVGDIIVHLSSGYDEFRLAGSPSVCASPVPSDWRGRIRVYHGTDTYDTVSKALLAARLSGARVKVTVENNSDDRCVLKDLVVLE